MNENEQGLVKAFTEGIVEGAGKQIPIYKDLLQPGVQVIGKGLADTIKLALIPITISIWGYEKIAEWLDGELEIRLKKVKPENIVSPKANVVGPAVEAIKFLRDEPSLREMFAQLIATSMNKETAGNVHPGFVETLKNLSGDDAKFIRNLFANKRILYGEIMYSTPNDDGIYRFVSAINPKNQLTDQILLSVSNLHRLGLIDPFNLPSDNDKIDFQEQNSEVINSISPIHIIHNTYFKCSLTNYGESFCESCSGNTNAY